MQRLFFYQYSFFKNLTSYHSMWNILNNKIRMMFRVMNIEKEIMCFYVLLNVHMSVFQSKWIMTPLVLWQQFSM